MRAAEAAARQLIQQQGRFFEHARDVRDEAAHDVAIDDAVVETATQSRHEAWAYLAVDDPRLLLDRAQNEDSHLAGVEDRSARVHAERAEVRDRELAARHLRRARLA